MTDTVIGPNDMVRVRNLGDENLRIAYDSKATVIPPGQDGFVAKEAACAHFGVWWSQPGGRPIDRKEEARRVKGLYGCFPGSPVEGDWENSKPKVEIYEMDGTRVSTVIEDPEGVNLPVTERQDDSHLRTTVQAMQEQLEKMQSQLDQKDSIISQGIATELPQEDTPDTAPKRTRNQPQVQAG